MIDGTLVMARPSDSVSEGHELALDWSEDGPGLLSCLVEADHHVAAHEEGCVRLLLVVDTSVVVNLVVLVALVCH